MANLTLRCEGSPVYETDYDPSSIDSLSETIIDAISVVEEVPPLDVAPLYDTIDPEGLTKLVEHATRAPRNSTLFVGFSLERWNVFVHSDGRVLVYDPASESSEGHDIAIQNRIAPESD